MVAKDCEFGLLKSLRNVVQLPDHLSGLHSKPKVSIDDRYYGYWIGHGDFQVLI